MKLQLSVHQRCGRAPRTVAASTTRPDETRSRSKCWSKFRLLFAFSVTFSAFPSSEAVPLA